METAEEPRPADALLRLADLLRRDETTLASHLVEPAGQPVLGALCAQGPRAAGAPAEYALVLEAVREGYLLHYGDARILSGEDADLALLAGDYLYALGIERLAALGDSDAVRELADLISLAAEARAEGRERFATPLWLSAAVAVGCGTSTAFEAAKAAARRLDPAAPAALISAARDRAGEFGLSDALDRAADSIHFRLADPDADG